MSYALLLTLSLLAAAAANFAALSNLNNFSSHSDWLTDDGLVISTFADYNADPKRVFLRTKRRTAPLQQRNNKGQRILLIGYLAGSLQIKPAKNESRGLLLPPSTVDKSKLPGLPSLLSGNGTKTGGLKPMDIGKFLHDMKFAHQIDLKGC